MEIVQPMSVTCPRCRRALKLDRDYRGETVGCPKCHIDIPNPQAAPRTAPTPAPVRPLVAGLADEIQKLHDLFKSGALTEDEFNHAKKSLLAGQSGTPEVVSQPGLPAAAQTPTVIVQQSEAAPQQGAFGQGFGCVLGVFAAIAVVAVVAVMFAGGATALKCKSCNGTGRAWGGLIDCPDCKGRGILGK